MFLASLIKINILLSFPPHPPFPLIPFPSLHISRLDILLLSSKKEKERGNKMSMA